MIKITSTIFKRRSKINERINLSKYQEIYVSNVLILMFIYKNFKQGIANILTLITSWLYLYEITKNALKISVINRSGAFCFTLMKTVVSVLVHALGIVHIKWRRLLKTNFKEIEKSVLIKIGCGAWQLQTSMENASRFNNHWQFIVKKHIWPWKYEKYNNIVGTRYRE